MTSFILTIDEQTADSAQRFDEVLLWTGSARSTFNGRLDPHLRSLGPVRQENVDFVRVALGVFAADLSVRRRGGGSDWNARDIALTVEVGNPAPWQVAASELSRVVGFLTGDHWDFNFVQAGSDPRTTLELEGLVTAGPEVAVLLSGGADSAAGALVSALDLNEGGTQILVSHLSSTSTSPFQKQVVKDLRRLAPQGMSIHRQTNLSRTSKRLDGTSFKSESSRRSRSLLFIALGLASAERAGVPLLIPENGFASLNPPLGPERRGALSTRTTHPRFLSDLHQVLTAVGAHGIIKNPFQEMTKGELFMQVADRIGQVEASAYLSATNSCSHTDARYSHAPAGSSCGVCFGCVVRRASFHAAGILDATEYLSDDRANRFADFVRGKSVIDAMRDFTAEDPKARIATAMWLPSDYSASDALSLCTRGVEELRAYLQ